MTSFTHLAQVDAVITRPAFNTTTGKGDGTETTVYANLKVTTPVSIDYNTAQRVGTTHRVVLQSPHKFKMTLFEGDKDVRQGDIMTIGSDKYPIRHVEKWPFILLGQMRMVAILEFKVRD